MKRIAMTVAALGIVYATAAAPVTASNARQLCLTPAISYSLQDQSNAQQPQVKTFTGTINKSGDQFILRDDAGNMSYQLDDQQSAGKHEGKKVKVVGTLDQANNVIRVQSIEETAA